MSYIENRNCKRTEFVTTFTKDALRTLLASKASDYPIALTITFKQTCPVNTAAGTYYRSLTPQDCERAAERFQQKLNREYFGKRGADKKGYSLRYLPILEGVVSEKYLHVHYGVGGLPATASISEFAFRVRRAMALVREVNIQYDISIADSGWFDYITKETGLTHTDNVLWSLVK